MTTAERLQIGEVADTVGLSIRTIRHYDEMGVVEPSGRSAGGFRLYTAADVERLRFVKRLKPLRFSLDEIQELLALLDAAATDRASGDTVDRLEWFASVSEERCAGLRAQLAMAEEVADEVRRAVPAISRRRR
jgi:MerR family copper efflux transcriptional regulator